MHAADRQHLRAVFRRGDVADDFAVEADAGLFRSEVPVGIDLHLEAAVTEDALGHDGDDIDVVMPGWRR